LGFLFTLTKSKPANQLAIVFGIIATGALVGLMLEVKKWFNQGLAKEAANKATEGADTIGLDKIGDSVKPTLAFTPWFYVAALAFLAAAFFCYKRFQSVRTLK